MKRKYFSIILVLTLAIFLSGCGVVTPATDEAKIKSVINEYFLAINDQNWSKALSYCVYGSDRYYDTRYLEDAINILQQYYGTVTITCLITISDVIIYGSYAEAFGSGTIIITAGGYFESESGPGTYYLQKIGNNWKIYGP
ncbi:hypothetical protein E3V08_02445 [Candidatus Atribacteria bacterium MT.SAG.1]|nr:hypothetical protein E3V08_02445 [Candidatus Atribacteria bacterium MT.SAG.1]